MSAMPYIEQKILPLLGRIILVTVRNILPALYFAINILLSVFFLIDDLAYMMGFSNERLMFGTDVAEKCNEILPVNVATMAFDLVSEIVCFYLWVKARSWRQVAKALVVSVLLIEIRTFIYSGDSALLLAIFDYHSGPFFYDDIYGACQAINDAYRSMFGDVFIGPVNIFYPE